MNRQSQQLVVAGVVAFLTSGIIALAGLSAAQDMNMGGTPPPGDGMGGMQQQPMMNQQPMMDMGGQQQFQPMNDYRPMDQGTPPMFQGTQEHDIGGGRMDFKRDGEGFQRDGENFQKDGPGFQRDGQNFHFGAPDFGGKEGADRGFRGGFEGREGSEREGGRFGRQPGMEKFDRQQMAPGKEGEMVEGGFRNTVEGGVKNFAPGNVEKAGGGLRTRGNFGGEGGMFKMGDGGMGGKMPQMPKIQLPPLNSLEELAAEEEEEVTLPPAVLKSLAKIEAGVTKDFIKVAKSWTKLEDKLEDGISKKEEKSLMTVGTKAEGIAAKVDHVLEQLAPYAEELDPENNEQFFTTYEKLEALSGQIGELVNDAASYLEE